MAYKHLLGLEETSRAEILETLDTARVFREVMERPIPKVPTLRAITVVNAFFENSTRTRVSFELAEKRLSADTVSFSAAGSSAAKGETLLDTARNLEAMGVQLVVIRHPSSGAPHFLARHLDAGVINAGDGQHEHPTQALLDLFTLRAVKGGPAVPGGRASGFEGLRVAIVGDITHSRVARSDVWGLTKLGAEVVIAGPATLLPLEIERMGCAVAASVDEALEGADAVIVLRLQQERMDSGFLPSLREYALRFGVTPERVARMKPDAIVMHPGPMNRGVEIDPAVADGERSVILEQVTNGVAVRMAVLYLASGVEQQATA
jgi:aspartate carbamoyltransferase catalytic subunit